MIKSKTKQRSPEKVVNLPGGGSPKKKETPKELSLKEKKAQADLEKRLAELKLKTNKITGALQWYTKLLDELTVTAASVVGGTNFDDESDDEDEEKKEDMGSEKVKVEGAVLPSLLHEAYDKQECGKL